jgi:hypothetical protein
MLNCGICVSNLCINQGATFQQSWTWITNPCACQGTAGAAPAPVDLTGYTASLQIRAYPGAPTIEYDATSNLTLGGVLGTIALLIPATSTALFSWWSGVYDLLLTSPAGIVTRLLQGKVAVSPSVTLPPPGTPIQTDSGLNLLTDSGIQINTSN